MLEQTALIVQNLGKPGGRIIPTLTWARLTTGETCSLNWLNYGELQRIVRALDARYVIGIDEDERLKRPGRELEVC